MTFYLETTLLPQTTKIWAFMFQSSHFSQNYVLLKFNRNLVQFLRLFALKISEYCVIICFSTHFEHYGRYELHQNTKNFHFVQLNKNRRLSCLNIVSAPITHKNQCFLFVQNFHERRGKIFGALIF